MRQLGSTGARDKAFAWRLFFLFGCAYFMSFAFRVVNAIIGPDLTQELHLSGGQLGLLTSVYLLAFGLLQLPLGVWLDRYPAATVNAALLLLAAAGALVFAASHSLTGLLIGRALIGAGVAACLMAAFRAFASWLSHDLQARLNLWMLVIGSSGAMVVTSPAEALLPMLGWRGLLVAMGLMTLAAAAALWLNAPRLQPALDQTSWGAQFAALGRILRSLAFWRFAPASIFVQGGFMALQGLWIAYWWVEVNGLARPEAARWLFILNGAVLASFLFLGAFVGAIERAGLRLTTVFGVTLTAHAGCLLWIVLLPAAFAWPLWILYSLLGCTAQLSYIVLNRTVAPELTGRTSVALNFAVMTGGFALQWGLGAAIDALAAAGASRALAYQAAFGLLAVMMLVSLAWFGAVSQILSPRR